MPGFAHDRGALAGLIVGCVAFGALVLALGIFAYRRHRVRHAEVAALGRGGPRSMVLDEEDDDGGSTRFIGQGAYHVEQTSLSTTGCAAATPSTRPVKAADPT